MESCVINQRILIFIRNTRREEKNVRALLIVSVTQLWDGELDAVKLTHHFVFCASSFTNWNPCLLMRETNEEGFNTQNASVLCFTSS